MRITEIAFGGRGVGRLDDGQVVFVPFVAADETVRVVLTKRHRGYAEARLLRVEEPSPHRVEPPCPYFAKCGGCSYQHLSAAEQLRIKGAQVAQVLRRIGKFAEPPMQLTIPSPATYGYRNRITVHVRDRMVGFYGCDPRELIDVTECPIAEPGVNVALKEFRRRPWMEAGHCTLRSDTRRRTFHQTNDKAAAELLRLVVNHATSGRWKHLVDAYCGSGFFAHALRDHFETVTGIERDGRAVTAAQVLADANERYLTGDVGAALTEVLADTIPSETLLVVDPPAEGLSAETRIAITARPPAAIIYVSCDPATLARDLKQLAVRYELTSVTPLDMFPQTSEIEVVVFLQSRAD